MPAKASSVGANTCQEHERLILPVMQSHLADLGCDAHRYAEEG